MSNTETNRPSHIVWQIIPNEREGEKDYWRRIGAAWPNRSETGFNLVLDSVPLKGRIAILPPKEGEDELPGMPAGE